VISPLLANICLHYVLDLWAERWRRREATGDMIIVRGACPRAARSAASGADDVVAGFEHEADARRFLEAMRARFEEFALSLHPDKTRLIEFGRHAATRRAQRGLGKPETFNFLGFTLICGKSRQGRFLLKRRTRRDRMRTKLQEIKGELRRRMHQPIPEQGQWLRQVVTGFFCLPRSANELSGTRGLPASHDPPLATRAAPAQSEGSRHVAAHRAAGRRLSPDPAHPPSMAQRSLRRQTPKVGAVCGKAARTDLVQRG
jgi:RNA-directed DNA polymerase